MTGRTYGWFKVESLTGARFELALDFFRNGRPFIFNGVAFAKREGEVECSVLSSWLVPTEETAAADLARAEQVLEELLQASPDFAALAKELSPVLLLVADSGMGTVALAECRDGVVRWTARGAV